MDVRETGWESMDWDTSGSGWGPVAGACKCGSETPRNLLTIGTTRNFTWKLFVCLFVYKVFRLQSLLCWFHLKKSLSAFWLIRFPEHVNPRYYSLGVLSSTALHLPSSVPLKATVSISLMHIQKVFSPKSFVFPSRIKKPKD
jgi:hypothetical protein